MLCYPYVGRALRRMEGESISIQWMLILQMPLYTKPKLLGMEIIIDNTEIEISYLMNIAEMYYQKYISAIL